MPRWAGLRLAVIAVLFAAWLGYLGYLVSTRPEVPTGPRVLSRPQAMTSTFDVIAEVTPDSDKVTIKRVLYPVSHKAWEGKTLRVPNLNDCGVMRGTAGPGFQRDITLPGEYLLLLNGLGQDAALVAPIPPSPGFSREIVNPRAYVATPDIRAQYAQVQKPAP
jgi:hypothetical protein